jgi:hypothetical protein
MISLFSTASRPALGLTHSPIQRVGLALSQRVKRPEREADFAPPSSVEVKHGGTILQLPYDLVLN